MERYLANRELDYVTTQLAGLGILIVEDEAAIRLLLEDNVTSLGCEVIGSVALIDQALAAIEESDIDLVLLDVNLAGATSYPAAEILSRKRVPFIFMTGGQDPEFAGTGGIYTTLRKPFYMREMVGKMVECLSRKHHVPVSRVNLDRPLVSPIPH